MNWLLKLLALLKKLLDLLLGLGKPVSGVIILGPTKERAMASKSKRAVQIPNFTMAELASKGATLQLYDAGDNPVPMPTTPHTHNWVSADLTVLTVTPSADGDTATVASTGKPGTGVRLDCFMHATDAPPSFPDLDCACTVDVPGGPPTQGTITIA